MDSSSENSGPIAMVNGSQKRLNRRFERARQVNRLQNDRIRDRIIDELEQQMLTLLAYAQHHQIPEHVPLPPSMPVLLTEQNIRTEPFRHYMVRRHILNAKDTLTEAVNLAPQDFTSFYRQKIRQQSKALERLLQCLHALGDSR